MNCKLQDLPVQRLSVAVDDKTVKSEYIGKKCTFIVNSKFNGEVSLSDLIYDLIVKGEQRKSLHLG